MKGLIDSSLLMLCENIQSHGELNTDTSREGLLDKDKTIQRERHSREKAQFIMCLCFFIQDLIGRALRSWLTLQSFAQGHFSRTDACQLKGPCPVRGHSLLSPSHPAAVFTIHSIQSIHHTFFMSMSKYCSEKALLYYIPCIYLKILSTGISIMN